MNPHPHHAILPPMKKALLTLGILIAVAVVGFYALNSYIYSEKQGDGTVQEPYRGTLTGEFVCLPHKDTSGPQTMECAFGLKTDVDEYYALDFALLSQGGPYPETGDRFTANGLITPIALLSTDQWDIYPIEGIFSVTDSVEIEE